MGIEEEERKEVRKGCGYECRKSGRLTRRKGGGYGRRKEERKEGRKDSSNRGRNGGSKKKDRKLMSQRKVTSFLAFSNPM